MIAPSNKELAAVALERLGFLRGLASLGGATPDDIEAASKEVREALLLLIGPEDQT